MNARILFLCLYSLLLLPGMIAADPLPYLKIKAEAGDGIYLLMRRYSLDQHSCNFDKFYALNNIKRNAHLVQGRTYQLPILIYPFNGKTIRSSIGINDWDLAVTIQNYNEQLHKDGIREAGFKEDKQLWVPHHLLHCKTADLQIQAPEPVSEIAVDSNFSKISNPSYRTFPIFGPKYEKTPLKSNTLAGQIFYLVSGHGGPDPGAIGKRGRSRLCEDEYAYDVALRLCRKLIEQGATAYMITRDPDDGIRSGTNLRCDEDEVVWGNQAIPAGQKARLTQRSDIINELYKKNRSLGFSNQKVIVIHVDSRSLNVRTDLFFYYQNENSISQTFAEQLLKTMQDKYKKYRRTGEYTGEIKTRDLHMLREIEAPTVYIELANIRNKTDQQRIVLESNREALAQWLYEGIQAK